MLSSLFRSLPRFPFRRWKPLDFSIPDCIVAPHEIIEEETLPDYRASRFYPIQIGEVFEDRYQVVGKLGYGVTSTVWLARDMDRRSYVTLKMFVNAASMGEQIDAELEIYQRLDKASRHPGRKDIRSLVDSFGITGSGPEDTHRCLVHPALFESLLFFLHRNPVQKLPKVFLAVVLHRLFLSLDYLHTECHTDIKADNIMLSFEDDSSFVLFEQQELQNPSPRKEIDGRSIYLTRDMELHSGKVGPLVLGDFGSAVLGDGKELRGDVQPNLYRAPEVILGAPWSYSIDKWNVGCMIWGLFEGGPLLTGHDPEFEAYRKRAHLAEMINLLGPPPASLLARGADSEKFFFLDSGEFREKSLLKPLTPLEARETTLEGEEDRESFLRFMRRMLQWEPEKRSTAKELAEDEWIQTSMKG
ncbi:kinase-like domain-containing protein [Aspergillus californicus]